MNTKALANWRPRARSYVLRRGLTKEGENEKPAKSTTTWANFEREVFQAQNVR